MKKGKILRVLGLIFVAIFTLGALSGCGGTETKASEVENTEWGDLSLELEIDKTYVRLTGTVTATATLKNLTGKDLYIATSDGGLEGEETPDYQDNEFIRLELKEARPENLPLIERVPLHRMTLEKDAVLTRTKELKATQFGNHYVSAEFHFHVLETLDAEKPLSHANGCVSVQISNVFVGL